MRTAFIKAFRWYVISMAVACGTTALMIAEETGSMRPVIFGILGYGFAYVIGALWKEMRGKSLGWGIGVFLGLTFVSDYVDDILYVLFAFQGEINKYVLWMSILTLVGLPLMTMVFKRVR